uniref:very-long-chain 3-oxoacyl-CoA synthase n=1 Tax=Gopherus evgoodei TaxID=1825980 RepID=A0A8C4XXN1_9SAUR
DGGDKLKSRTGAVYLDIKTDPWLLVYSPLPVTLLFTLYLLFVALGPRLMRKWEPLRLKGLLTAYNLTLVALSIYMFCDWDMFSFCH